MTLDELGASDGLAPIETVVKGYRMRSRLEARWATFFDALSIGWVYEPEGFDLGEEGWYLPDFQIDGDIYVEVKPRQGSYKANIWRKCESLCEVTDRRVLLIMGQPFPGEYLIHEWTTGAIDIGATPPDEPHDFEFAVCRWCSGWGLRSASDTWGAWVRCESSCGSVRLPVTEHSRLDAAYQAARSARFEEGDPAVIANLEKQQPKTPRERIYEYLSAIGVEQTTWEIVNELHMNRAVAIDLLNQLATDGRLTKRRHGRAVLYAIAPDQT